MSFTSTLEYLGIRFGTLGTTSYLPIAAPLAEGDVSTDAHTDAQRIGVWFDRSVGDEAIYLQVLGIDTVGVFIDRLEVLGNEVWHAGNITPQDISLKGVANGYASLDSTGRVPVSQLPSSITGALSYVGVWDANTNTPTLSDGTGSSGELLIVSVAGSQDLGSGSISFVVGDQVAHNGTIWQKIPDSGTGYLVKASPTDAVPGTLEDKVDGVTIDVSGDQLVVLPGGITLDATAINVDTSGFSTVLSGADTDVQLALDTLDAHGHDISAITEYTDTGSVALTDSVAVEVDSTATGTSWKWTIQIDDGAGNYVLTEVIAAAQGANDIDYTVLPSTASFPHTIDVDRTSGTTALDITASGVGYSARALRLELT